MYMANPLGLLSVVTAVTDPHFGTLASNDAFYPPSSPKSRLFYQHITLISQQVMQDAITIRKLHTAFRFHDFSAMPFHNSHALRAVLLVAVLLVIRLW